MSVSYIPIYDSIVLYVLQELHVYELLVPSELQVFITSSSFDALNLPEEEVLRTPIFNYWYMLHEERLWIACTSSWKCRYVECMGHGGNAGQPAPSLHIQV